MCQITGFGKSSLKNTLHACNPNNVKTNSVPTESIHHVIHAHNLRDNSLLAGQ